jgi:hypothetical protein
MQHNQGAYHGRVRLLVRTGTQNIRLLVRMGSDRSIVGPGRNRLLGTGLFLTWFVAELIQQLVHRVVLERSNCLFTADRSEPK